MLPPDRLTTEHIRCYQLHLTRERHVSGPYFNQAVCAMRFFYREVLKTDSAVDEIRYQRTGVKSPEVQSPQEVAALFQATRRHLKHRALLMRMDAGGLRVSEVTHLRGSHIDSQRMVIRIEQGQGRKDRSRLRRLGLEPVRARPMPIVGGRLRSTRFFRASRGRAPWCSRVGAATHEKALFVMSRTAWPRGSLGVTRHRWTHFMFPHAPEGAASSFRPSSTSAPHRAALPMPEVGLVQFGIVGAPAVDRKLAAIFSADVEGYSRLMGQDEVATVRTLTEYRETMASVIGRHRGRVVDSPGDNLLADFASVVDAVECAVEIQQELKRRNGELPPFRQMQFRIGINLGDVIVNGDRIYGDGVNIAARVQSLADGGGICLSGTAYEHVETKLPLAYEFLGEQTVKNIAKPVRVYRVGLEAGARPAAAGTRRRRGWRRWPKVVASLGVVAVLVGGGVVARRLYRAPAAPQALALPDRPSIAVLPFANLSGDPAQEYFSDGMTEDLITGLSKISGLFVIARNSVVPYKGRAVRPEQVSRDLGVRYVMEGSVRKAGNRVRITAQFIDATSGYHLWAERYDRELKDIFAVQDEVTQKIVRATAVKLTDREQSQLGRSRTANLEAYDDVLRGFDHLRRTTPEESSEARRLFARAVGRDPQYAKAYAALGWVDLQAWQLQWTQEAAVLDRALELGQKAIARDDSCVDAYRLLSQVYLWKKQHDRAIAEAERAVSLDPNDADGYETLAEVLSWAGRGEEGIRFIKKAMRLNPHHPFYYLWALGHAYYLTGRADEAMGTFRRLIEQNPNFVAGHAFLAVLLSESGREAEAQAEGIKALRLSPQVSLDGLRERLPYKNAADLDRLLRGMRRAGLR